MFGHINSRHANAAVGHAIIDVETVGLSDVIAPVNACGEYDFGHDAMAKAFMGLISRLCRLGE